MLRPITPDDTEALVKLTAETGFFKPMEVDTLREVLDDFHAINHLHQHQAHAWEENGRILGYAYYAPAAMTDRSWYLYWIAVEKTMQGKGLGGRLLRFVEEDIQKQGGRLLLIETSSTTHYEPTRRFYLKYHYALVATIPDYYADDDGLVVFSKRVDRPGKH